MLLAIIFASLFVILSIVVAGMIMEPLESIRKDQPDYYKSFEHTLSPFSPLWFFPLILFLVFAEYKKNVRSPSTVAQLGKARPIAILQLMSLIMAFVMFFVNW